MRPKRKRKKRDPIEFTLEDINYKNIKALRQVMSGYSKILPAKTTGATSKMQRKLAREIKRARIMALLPYIRR